MRRAQQMIDVVERGLRQRAQGFARHHHDVFAHDSFDAHAQICAVRCDFPVRRVVLADRKQRRVLIWRRRMSADGDVHAKFRLGSL